MKLVRNIILALAITLPTLASACGYYGRFDFDPPLTSKTIKAQGIIRMTSETFQFYVDPDGKEVRHGITTQFDSRGNKIAEARYQHGTVMDGTVAHIYLSCGVAARRNTYAKGVNTGTERLHGQLVGKEEQGNFGFEVDTKQHLTAKAPASGNKAG